MNKYFKDEEELSFDDRDNEPKRVGLAGRLRHSILVMKQEYGSQGLQRMKTTKEEQSNYLTRQVTYISKVSKKGQTEENLEPQFNFLKQFNNNTMMMSSKNVFSKKRSKREGKRQVFDANVPEDLMTKDEHYFISSMIEKQPSTLNRD